MRHCRTAAHLGLPSMLEEAALSMFPTSPGVVVGSLKEDLDVDADWDPSYLHRMASSMYASVSERTSRLIQEKWNEFSSNFPSIARDVFCLALRGFNTLDDQHQLLSCVDALRSDAR